MCLGCGLCCEGVLHTHANIQPAERRAVRALGLAQEMFGDHAGFRLPCPLYQAGRCSVYQRRLRACQTYRCELLGQHLAGHLTLEQSLEIVRGARALLAEIEPPLPPGRSFNQLRDDVSRLETRISRLGSLEAHAAQAPLLLSVARVDRYLQRYFKK